jgi:hypothetical protein
VSRALKAAVIGLVVAGALVAAGPASAAPTWAPAATAAVHPGVQTYTEGGQCTANFIYYDATDIYIGQAAHCAGTGEATDTNGCDAGSLPLGTAVEVTGASRPGTLAYSSWLSMQAAGETDADTCDYNDLALVRLDPADHGKVNPSIPFWGGPTGLTDTVATGAKVLSYGNSSLRAGIAALAQGGRVARPVRRRLDALRVHGHAGRPRRLRQRVHRQAGARVRHALHARDRAADRLQRRRRPVA